jgi:prepilin-type N-terminal cleavage/methylation domain-containing protein
MKPLQKYQQGLTLIELVVVFGILAVLFSIGVVSLANTRIITSNNTSTSVLISDLKAQQIKAMAGDTEGRGTPDNYGIKILPDQYVLFHGTVYNSSDASNFSVPADSGYVFTTTFPNETILFSAKSGEIAGFNESQNGITIANTTTNQSKTVLLNKYGTVVSSN